MTSQRKVIIGGCVAVVLFDVLASAASRSFAFPYARASVGSYFIYAAVGFLAGRCSDCLHARAGARAAAIAGFADASLGWAASWMIGPGRTPSGSLTPLTWILTAIMVAAFASMVGFLGGAVGGRSRPPLGGSGPIA